jgi:hypothetical protein
VGPQKDGGQGGQADEKGTLGQGRLNGERHGVTFLVYYDHRRKRDGISEAWRGVYGVVAVGQATCIESRWLPVVLESTGAEHEDHGDAFCQCISYMFKVYSIIATSLSCLAGVLARPRAFRQPEDLVTRGCCPVASVVTPRPNRY